jgi:hypothetical protein
MPRWAWAALALLLLAFICSLVLNTIVVFTLISRSHINQMEVCHLYFILHRDQLAVVIPPNCLP